MANCLTAARNLRLEEARMDKEACEKEEQAERLEREARALDEEAARLEREARQNGQGGWWRGKEKILLTIAISIATQVTLPKFLKNMGYIFYLNKLPNNIPQS